MDCPIRHILSRIDLPSVHGRQVSAALGKAHNRQAAVPRTNILTLHYEAYEALQVRAAIWNCVIWRRLPFARHRVPPGRYQGAIRLVEHSAARDGLKCYLSDRTVSISNVCCFIQKCLLDNAINKGVDFVASFRYLWIVRNDDYRFPDCVEFLKEAHYIARCSCI